MIRSDALASPTTTDTLSASTRYRVTGSNTFGSSTAAAQVNLIGVDLTPMLMLLLD